MSMLYKSNTDRGFALMPHATKYYFVGTPGSDFWVLGDEVDPQDRQGKQKREKPAIYAR